MRPCEVTQVCGRAVFSELLKYATTNAGVMTLNWHGPETAEPRVAPVVGERPRVQADGPSSAFGAPHTPESRVQKRVEYICRQEAIFHYDELVAQYGEQVPAPPLPEAAGLHAKRAWEKATKRWRVAMRRFCEENRISVYSVV